MYDPFEQSIRKTMKELRAETTITYRINHSHLICKRILHSQTYRNAKRIALYSAVNGEVDLHALFETAPFQGKFCYFPSINEDLTLSFLPVVPQTPFKENQYGILEPEVPHEKAIALEELDLILLPTVAFDKACSRMGMGKGYYDRTLKNNKKTVLWGVAYDFQQVDFIVRAPWDIPLDAVVTPSVMYKPESI